MDFDPRDFDSRDDDRWSQEKAYDGRDLDDRRDESVTSDARLRDRDDDGRSLGRGPSNRDEQARCEARDRDNVRSPERDHDVREVFVQTLNLPRGLERELVRDRDREYSLRGSEARTLSILGAFRVVSSRDLRDYNGRPADPRKGDLRHLREEGLIRTVPMAGSKDVAVVLTGRGRELLESRRPDRGDARDHRQAFYADLKKPREVEHDS